MKAIYRNNAKWFLFFLVVTFFSSVFFGLISQLDLLGINSATATYSENIILQLFGGPFYKSHAQKDIAVVLVDNEFVRDFEETWPMSYLVQSQLLEVIKEYEPKAIFLDFLYQFKHGNDTDLSQYIQEIRQTTKTTEPPCSEDRIPIFIPYLMNEDGKLDSCGYISKTVEHPVKQNSVLPEFKQSCALPTYIGWQGCGKKYPAFFTIEHQADHEYEYNSPAYAMYRYTCDHLNISNAVNKYDCDQSDKNFDKPMMIRWGTFISQEQNELYQAIGISCSNIPREGRWQRLWYSISQLLAVFSQSLTSTLERGVVEQCSYTNTVHAGLLFDSDPELRELIVALLKDKIVFVGASIDGNQDIISNPINKTLPGVYLFPMALDNYLTYGEDYYRPLTKFNKLILEISVLWASALIFGLFAKFIIKSPQKDNAYMHHHNKTWEDLGKALKRQLSKTMVKFSIPLIFCAGIIICMMYMGKEPMDWIGVSILSLVNNSLKTNNIITGCGHINS